MMEQNQTRCILTVGTVETRLIGKKVAKMNVGDVLCWVVIGGAMLLVFGFVLWSLFEIARLSNESSEEYWEKYLENKEE